MIELCPNFKKIYRPIKTDNGYCNYSIRCLFCVATIEGIYQNGIYLLYQYGIIMSRGEIMRLKELRKQKGISQLKLAMDLSMNQNSISRYENGEREADYTTLVRFADYFNVSVDYLLERTDNPNILK